MANLFAWLLAAAWPIAKKVLTTIGIGWLTYEGLGLIASQVQAAIIAQWGSLPESMMQMASLLGMPQALGILLGAINARVALVAAGRLGNVTK